MARQTTNQMVREIETVLAAPRAPFPVNIFTAAIGTFGPCIATTDTAAFVATFFPAHHDAHVKEWHITRKLAASAHITTESLLADLRRAREGK